MTKYLRCHTAGVSGQTVGERYEVIHEDDRLYTIRGFGGYTKLPDSGGDSYRNWFILEKDEITVLPDESLGGIEREYREVKRKATVGERIKIITGRDAFLGQDFYGTTHEVTDVVGFNVETTGKWKDGSVLNPDHDDYVVLEPTNIVRIAGERLRMVDRKARVGDRVIIVSSDKTKSVGCAFRHKVSEAGDVESRLSDRAGVNGWYILDGDYHILEPLITAPLLSEQSAQDQAAATISTLALRLDALTERIDTLEAKVNAVYTTQTTTAVDPEAVLKAVRKFSEGLKRSVSDALKTPQQRRDEIVERAKADVKRLTQIGDSVSDRLPKSSPLHNDFFRVEFVVNRERRTIVALLRPEYGSHFDIVTGSFSVIKGTAKCAPGDVFNAHIGKAISLRRALGLEVPAEYLSVPRPTEVRVGDIVEGTSHSGATGPVLETGHDGEENFVIYRNDTNLRYVNKCWSGVARVIILDDTREEVAA
ncbi:hypothetical protein ACTP13_19475 [Paenibacillus peoriae]|uniref:hypothetical protein n=1 Tax=Paenibacillus peoriae TaxID=59893 RepID=UPI003F9ACD77